MNFQFQQNSLNLKLYQTSLSETEVVELGKILKKGSGRFVPSERTPGFTGIAQERDVLTGVFNTVTVSAIPSFNLETLNDEDVFVNKHETCEFVLCPGLVIAQGSGGAMKLMESALACASGGSIVGKEFDYQEMEVLLDILTNIKAISVKNPKDSEVRTANITGVIEDLDGYNFLAAQPLDRTIESVRGSYTLDGYGVEVKLTRKGGLTISGRRGMQISLESITEFLRVIEQKMDEPDMRDDEETLSNLF